MQPVKPLFSDKYLLTKFQHLTLPDTETLNRKLELISRWKKSLINQSIAQSKEESLQGHFLQQFFGEVLDYSPHKDLGLWHLETEQKTSDGGKMDGALGFFRIEGKAIHADIRAVIELKDAKTDLDKPQNRLNDKRTPVQQAFDYANAVGGTCRWVIVSNFREIRLYFQTDRTRYQAFDILLLDNLEKFRQFYFLLHKDRLIQQDGDSATDKLYFERQAEELAVSKDFYQDYKQARFDFFCSLKTYNPGVDELLLLNKTQKLLNRITFIHFCEAHSLIDSNTLRDLINFCKKDKFNFEKSKIFPRLKNLFSAINAGHPPLNINKFNGGLFKEDEEFNNLIIDDAILAPVLKLIDYDFKSDLDVNILGHIFEQSISDIEELKAEINKVNFEKKQGKRKKDGIYYTPDSITHYIVEEAIGGWLKEQRDELNESELPELTDMDWESIAYVSKGKNKGVIKRNSAIQAHIDFYEAYKTALSKIKVLDPACGSGAFLNQAFDFLLMEGNRINAQLHRLHRGQTATFDWNKHILEHNLFGVDLNEESVEITKLSLWIKTANNKDELTSLDDNIKCGNSLIDDANVAGKKAFVWEKEFKEIMENGGFDVIIGNPPYVFAREKIDLESKNFYNSHYISAEYQLNTYILFIEKAIKLLKNNGFYGLIVPNSWLMVSSAASLRKYILETSSIKRIVNLEGYSFENANVETIILISKKELEENNLLSVISKKDDIFFVSHEKLQKDFYLNKSYEFRIFSNDSNVSILNKIKLNSVNLNALSHVKSGLIAYEIGKGNPKQTENDVQTRPYDFNYKFDNTTYKYLEGQDVNRYLLKWSYHYLKYGENLAAPRTFNLFESNKIIIREITGKYPKSVIATYIEETYLFNRSNIAILSKENDINLKYILSLLNSSLMSFYFMMNTAKSNRKMFPKIILNELKEFPIKKISEDEQKPFIEKVDIMLEENKKLQQQISSFLNFIQAELNPQKISSKLQNYYQLTWQEFKAELKKTKVDLDKNFDLKKRREWEKEFEEEKQKALSVKNLIDQTDAEIDAMVYQLYGLSADDIAVIEKS